jgi:hypothetical protein
MGLRGGHIVPGMRIASARAAVVALAAGCLAYAAALHWFARHIRRTAGAALTAYGDVADLFEVLAYGLVGHAIVLAVLAGLPARARGVRWTIFGLVSASVPVQALVLLIVVHDHGHVLAGGQRAGDPTEPMLWTMLATAAWTALASAVTLAGPALRRRRPAGR